jgi:hypothetical protein
LVPPPYRRPRIGLQYFKLRHYLSYWTQAVSRMERNMPTAEPFEPRGEFYEPMAELRDREPESSGPFPTPEEMIREDRDR